MFGIDYWILLNIYPIGYKYGVKSPKYIWAPCVQLYSLAETPKLPPPVLRMCAQKRGRYWSASKIDDISFL
jgi:hypothetical protein